MRTEKCSKICESVDQALDFITNETKVKTGAVIVNDVILKHYKNTFKLSGYPGGPEDEVPLFFIFKYGYPETYQGPSDFKEMVTYFKNLKDRVFASARDMATMDQKHKVLEDIWHTSIIVYLKEYNNYDLMRAGYVLDKDGIIIYFTKNEKIAKSLGLNEFGDFLISQPFIDRVYGKIANYKTYRQLIHFIRQKQVRTLLPVTGANVISIFKAYDRVIIAFVDDLNKDYHFLTSLFNIAKSNTKQDVTFVYTEVKRMEGYLKQIGVSTNHTPILLRLDTKLAKRTVFDNERFNIREEEQIEKWVIDQLGEQSGKMDVITSQEEPSDNESRALKVITRNNFSKFTGYGDESQENLAKDQIRIVVFSRPNCPHCVKLEPILQELANKYKSSSSIKIGKYDVLVNDLPPSLSVPYLPTIFLFKRCSEVVEMIKYNESDRTLELLESFISKNQCTSVKDEF